MPVQMKVFLSFFLLLLLISRQARSQEFTMNDGREIRFVFEVKQIDEFIERFNDIQNTLLRQYLSRRYPGIIIRRQSLLNSLFDRQGKYWKMKDRKIFVKQIVDSTRPAFLNFYNDDWYAELLCKFKFKGNDTDVTLILKVQKTPNGGSKWIIASAYSNSIEPSADTFKLSKKYTPGKFLNPISHATDFAGLSKAFENKEEVQDYLDSSFLKYPFSKAFMKSMLNRQLQFLYIRKISYHFFQVNGWEFTVNNFQRNSMNSGWLISSLARISPAAKREDENKLLRNKL
jgi:hypothetical protein